MFKINHKGHKEGTEVRGVFIPVNFFILGLQKSLIMKKLYLAILCSLSLPAFAQTASDPTPLKFQDSAEERRFHALASELRCVMCQNQSLADSTR